jgi:D-alanyl-D-alanine carboxypeptidase/D-alanyl-D-alanine-endopeptidase (penicillin-binding protein 4)
MVTMRTGSRLAVLAFVVVGLGAYAVADAADVAPGVLTLAPPSPSPEPFPSAAAASPFEAPDEPAVLLANHPAPSAAAIQALVDGFLADSRIGTSTGVSVVDLATGETLASASANVPRIPASNVKLLTAAAALSALGPDLRLKTSVVWDGAGSVTIVAGGDMMLAEGYGHYGEKPSANGWAGLAELADQVAVALKAEGVTNVSVAYDDSAFGAPRVNPNWPANPVKRGYSAPITGLAVDVGWTGNEDYKRYDDPSLRTAQLFGDALAARGVEVMAVAGGSAPTGAVQIGEVEGAPMLDVVGYMLTYSENTIAEDLARVVALDAGRPGTTAEATRAVLAADSAYGLDTSGILMADGSGLDRNSRISAKALTDLLVLLAADPVAGDVLRDLPVANISGTLASRFAGTEGAGTVRAKTGTLNGASALSGTVVTDDGAWLGFSILLNGLPVNETPALGAMDKFVASLASCGCG